MVYTNDFIIKQIKLWTKLVSYNELFENMLSGEEILTIFDDFVTLANIIRNRQYDEYSEDDETDNGLKDFKQRYDKGVSSFHKVMLEIVFSFT